MQGSRTSAAQVGTNAAAPRRVAAFVLVALLGCMLAAATPARASGTLPLQGVYEICAPGENCASRLQRISQDGFKLVLNYWQPSSSVQATLDYAAAARQAGLKVIWSFEGFRFDYATNRDTRDLVDLLVNTVKDLPETWGYYISDETPANEADGVASVSQAIRSLDSNHPQLTVGCGMCTDPAGNLRPYRGMSDVIAEDIYPVINQPPGDPSVPAAVAATAAQTQSLADGAGRSSAIVLQAWSWQDSGNDSTWLNGAPSRFPTAAEMLAMRNAALLNANPQIILWFGYFDVAGWSSPPQMFPGWIAPTDTTSREAALTAAAFAPYPSVPASLSSSPSTPSAPASAPSGPAVASTGTRSAAIPHRPQIGYRSKRHARGRRNSRAARSGRHRRPRSSGRRRGSRVTLAAGPRRFGRP